MRAGAYVKERSERRWRRRGTCGEVAGRCGAVAQWRKRACEWEGVLGRRASMGPTHVAWMCVGKGLIQ
eukprot:scaffold27387_cov63-Phaeocystis_antarctica.AAC.3